MEVYSDYIKTVIDVESGLLAIGGEFMAMSNYKPALGKLTYEIADEKIRKQLAKLTKEFLEL